MLVGIVEPFAMLATFLLNFSLLEENLFFSHKNLHEFNSISLSGHTACKNIGLLSFENIK